MAKKDVSSSRHTTISAQPRIHQHAAEIQAYGTVSQMAPLQLEEPVRLEMTEQLNLLLADTMTLRDLYKKSHWQVAGPTFYQLHLLFDKHYAEQVEMVDTIAERIQLLGGVSVAMAADIAETTRIERPPRGREEVPVQISRLLDAHQIIIGHCRELAKRADELGDDGTNDMVISDVLRGNELQTWFLSEHWSRFRWFVRKNQRSQSRIAARGDYEKAGPAQGPLSLRPRFYFAVPASVVVIVVFVGRHRLLSTFFPDARILGQFVQHARHLSNVHGNRPTTGTDEVDPNIASLHRIVRHFLAGKLKGSSA